MITATFSSGDPEEIDVLLVVTPSDEGSELCTLPFVLDPKTGECICIDSACSSIQSLQNPNSSELSGCTPEDMEIVATTVGNGLDVSVSFPHVLLAEVVDSCGEAVQNATVVASVEGNTISMPPIDDGLYSASWVPLQVGTPSISFTALHPILPAANLAVLVSANTAVEGIQLPVLFPNGVVEAAGFTPLRPLAPGGFITLFGSRLAEGNHFASQIPLERGLGGVQVKIGNETAPLHFVGPGQVNAQVPLEFEAGAEASIVINANGRLTLPQNYTITRAFPGIFVRESGFGAVLDGQSQLLNPENPAVIGDVLQIFSTGLGKTNPLVETGAAGPPFSTVTTAVTVKIGGIEVPVAYQGLAPNFVALYQVNVIVPSGPTPGETVPIVFIQDGVESNTNLPATIPISNE